MGYSGIGLSLILIATGAILAWAVDYQTTGVDINVVGGILMVVGAIGLVFSLLLITAVFGGERGSGHSTGHHID